MRPVQIAIALALFSIGCAYRPVQSIDRNAAINLNYVEHDVLYRTVGGKKLHLNVYLPDEFIGEHPWWVNGERKETNITIHPWRRLG